MPRARLTLATWNADLAAVTTAVVFLVLVWSLFAAVSQAGRLQQQARDAQNVRGAFMRAVLDQETGLRGYVATGRQIFLQPYNAGGAVIAKRLDDELLDMQRLGTNIDPKVVAAIADERSAYFEWRSKVAAPLLADNDRRNATELQVRGKNLIDRIRADNETIVNDLDQTGRTADESLAVALRKILLFGVLGAILLIAVVRFATRAALRLQENLHEQQLRYESEKRVADAFQKAFLQRTLPNVPGLEMHAVYIPAEQEARVGGDWYDAVVLPDGEVFVSVGDVGGHGIEAAVVMSRARQSLLSLATLEHPDPAAILEHVNRILLLQGQTMVTALCCFIDPRTFEVRYASAGHPPPVLVQSGGEPQLISGHGVPLGVVSDAKYTSQDFTAGTDAFVVLYTDGVTEYSRDIVAGEAALLRAARHVARGGRKDPAGALRDAIFRHAKPVDDVAILTLSFRRPGSETAREEMRKTRPARLRRNPRIDQPGSASEQQSRRAASGR